jgi:hypothetical protein
LRRLPGTVERVPDNNLRKQGGGSKKRRTKNLRNK